MNRNHTVAGDKGRAKSSWAARLVVALAVLLGGLLLSLLIVQVFGDVSGEEFRPIGFKRRRFFYKEVPLLHIQITPIRRADATDRLPRYLTSNKYIGGAAVAKPRWDLVSSNRVQPTSTLCDSRILCAYLDRHDDGDVFWLEWTKNNPKLAKVFWPLVEKVAQQKLYIFVPDLVDLARTANNAQQLRRQSDEMLAANYESLARTQQRLGRHEQAVEWFSEALAHDAERASALQGRITSLEALDRADRAAADRQAVDRLRAQGH